MEGREREGWGGEREREIETGKGSKRDERERKASEKLDLLFYLASNLVGFCFQTKLVSTSLPLKTESTRMKRSTVSYMTPPTDHTHHT